MKIKPEHYKVIERAITPIMKKYPYEMGWNPHRYRWDLLWASKLKIGDGKGMSGLPIYAYAHDDHIDTALRKITGLK